MIRWAVRNSRRASPLPFPLSERIARVMNVDLANSGTTAIAERSPAYEVIIEPRTGWRAVDLVELYTQRDLLSHLIWKNIKARYVQSVLGPAWALIQPIATMLIYTIVFSRVAKVPIPFEGPYPLFAFCGILPWTFFAGALTSSASCLIQNNQLISKVYFPRMILPVSEVPGPIGRAVDLVGRARGPDGPVPRLPEARGGGAPALGRGDHRDDRPGDGPLALGAGAAISRRGVCPGLPGANDDVPQPGGSMLRR